MAIPVHLIAGFLGTGKTTALLSLLGRRPEGERVAVIVNDFGQAAIDESTLGASGRVRLAEIAGACVCCTAPEGFTEALHTLLDEVRPDRILIEPTGLARPADLVDTLRRSPRASEVALGPVIVLVDPHTLDPDAVQVDPLLREQAEAADVLVANRTDLASAEELARFDAWAASLWPGPLRTLHTVRGALPDDVLRWPDGTGPRVPRHGATPDHDHDHDLVHGHRVRSFVFPPDAVFSRQRLLDVLGRLAGGDAGATLARFKGLFRTDEGMLLVEVAGQRVHERSSAWRRDSRADVILEGGGDASFEAIGRDLDGARLTSAELATDPHRLEVVLPDGRRTTFRRGDLRDLPDPVPDVSLLVPKREGEAARLGALLERLQVDGPLEAVVVAADGFATPAVPLEVLREGLLLHSVEGAPLPDGKGGPFRLLIPGDAAPAGPCSNVKGVVRVVLRAG